MYYGARAASYTQHTWTELACLIAAPPRFAWSRKLSAPPYFVTHSYVRTMLASYLFCEVETCQALSIAESYGWHPSCGVEWVHRDTWRMLIRFQSSSGSKQDFTSIYVNKQLSQALVAIDTSKDSISTHCRKFGMVALAWCGTGIDLPSTVRRLEIGCYHCKSESGTVALDTCLEARPAGNHR